MSARRPRGWARADGRGASEPRVRPGDIWQLGDHRVACGDGRDRAFLAELIGEGERIDCAFLDPPYNVKINGHANAKGRHREFAMASGEMTAEVFRTFLAETLGACTSVSRDGAVHFICMDWRHIAEIQMAGSAYAEMKNLIVWVKDNGGMGTFYRSRHELVFAFKNGTAPHTNSFELGQHGRYRSNVWQYRGANSFRSDRLEELRLHPTVKPVAMIADAIKDVSARGGIVLDLFGGSGSTLIAAEQTGRRAFLMELDQLYCDVIVQRWEKFTGKKAECVSNRSNAPVEAEALSGGENAP